MDPLTLIAALAAGALIGLVLGLVGGGGSILAVPLLALFGMLMIAVGALMLRRRGAVENPGVRLSRDSAGHLLPRLMPAGLGVGLLAGFFGIGGGFMIVPALIATTAMPIGVAIGTSLVVVTALGASTAGSYAVSGYVDWTLVALLALGGAAGTFPGRWIGKRLAARKGLLNAGFAAVVIAVGAFVTWQGSGALLG